MFGKRGVAIYMKKILKKIWDYVNPDNIPEGESIPGMPGEGGYHNLTWNATFREWSFFVVLISPFIVILGIIIYLKEIGYI